MECLYRSGHFDMYIIDLFFALPAKESVAVRYYASPSYIDLNKL